MQTNHESISEASNTIQRFRRRARLLEYWTTPFPSQKNAAKQLLGGVNIPGSCIVLQGLKRVQFGFEAASRPGFFVVIHSLWINMWITTLIACKS